MNDVPIAGMIKVSHFLAGGGSGMIQSVGNDGTMKISGGPILRINTPSGLFATAYTGKPTFTADEGNPSIVSFSGFPMCIPRSATDPLCPTINRPAGTRVFRAKDPLAMAPFQPGDFVTYAGIKNGATEYLCYSIVAENVQILTSGDSGEPVYLRVEDALIGVSDGSASVEIAETRYIGYISDSTATVSVYALDMDPCTGVETERQVAAGTLKVGDARFKFVIRFIDTAITKATREYRIKASKGAVKSRQGIQAGQYVCPITEVVWPEITVPGTPPPQNAFHLFSHLANGFVMDNMQFGPLRPWPGSPVPTPSKICTGNELGGISLPKDTVTITVYTFVANAGGTITVSATSSTAIQGQAGARLLLFIGAEVTGRAMTQDTANFGSYTYTARNIGKLPSGIKVTSVFGGSDSRASVLKRSSKRSRLEG